MSYDPKKNHHEEEPRRGEVERRLDTLPFNPINFSSSEPEKAEGPNQEPLTKISQEKPPDLKAKKEISPEAKSEPKTNLQALVFAFAALLRINLNLYRGGFNRLAREIKEFTALGINSEQVEKFGEYWYTNDFRGIKGEPPTIEQVRLLWDTAIGWTEAEVKPIKPKKTRLEMIAEQAWGSLD